MNKKQAFIIATLLVLIVCAGILATKVNSPLYVNGDLSGSKSDVASSAEKSNTSTSDYFAEARLSREQTNAKLLQNLKTLIDDQNAGKEARETASRKYNTITLNYQSETKVESALKAKQYDDSVCTINDDKVNIIVRSKDKLTDKQAKQIKDIVMGITKIKNVEIEQRQ